MNESINNLSYQKFTNLLNIGKKLIQQIFTEVIKIVGIRIHRKGDHKRSMMNKGDEFERFTWLTMY